MTEPPFSAPPAAPFLPPGTATESHFPEFKRATLEMVRAQGALVGWTAPFAALAAAR